jgi:glycosyltransferase involved in cell wall biosynthesis
MSEVVPGLVSTIIPVHNRAGMLREAVASVIAQTWRPIEVIIADDGSTDDTVQAGEALAAAHPGEVRYAWHSNGGPGIAREHGRRLARGEFIQYLDSDDRLLNRKFEVQVATLRSRPECGIAYGRTRLIDTDGHVLASPFKWTGEARDSLFPGLLVDRWWCTHTPLYRRAVADAIGPWCDLRYSQDWEYDMRAGALGVRLAFCREDVSEHRHHAGARQTGNGRWLVPADRVRFFRKLYECASQAGVPLSSAEMRHFSRWVFSHARESAALGDAEAARELCLLAAKASAGRTWDVHAYVAASGLLGWKRASGWFDLARRCIRSNNSPDTLKQSWME